MIIMGAKIEVDELMSEIHTYFDDDGVLRYHNFELTIQYIEHEDDD